MVNFRQPIIDEQFNNSFSSDNMSNSRMNMEEIRPKTAPASALNAKINTVRDQLEILKCQMQKEKMLLEEERKKIFNSSFNKDKDGTMSDYSAPLPSSPSNQTPFTIDAVPAQPQDKTFLSAPSKKHLEDIERQCDLELIKLQSYLSNIGELKTHWRCLMTKNQLGQFQSVGDMNQRIGEFADACAGSKSENYFN